MGAGVARRCLARLGWAVSIRPLFEPISCFETAQAGYTTKVEPRVGGSRSGDRFWRISQGGSNAERVPFSGCDADRDWYQDRPEGLVPVRGRRLDALQLGLRRRH